MTKKILDVLSGKKVLSPPIWLMRQAGRYLPEYRALRIKTKNFLDLCYNPQLACEITLQPIRRFGFDAAIVFSDILVIPHALGRALTYESGEGPVMDPLQPSDIDRLETEQALSRLEPVFETLQRARKSLDPEKSLIGFCGAPWTVATYMIAGRATSDQVQARLFLYQYPQFMQKLLEILADISADYLIKQIEAGADLVQIFDSWASVLDDETFEICAIRPVKRMVKKIKARFPDVPVIGFPRGAGLFYENYAEKTGVNALSLDWNIPIDFAAHLQKSTPVQGNLDPQRLVAGGQALEKGIEVILNKLGRERFIFNLGHGIDKHTPLENVARLVAKVREFSV